MVAALAVLGLLAAGCLGAGSADYRLATFTADATPPIGHPCLIGNIKPATTIVDPLEARGFVLLGPDEPLVFVTVDWCEVRNDAYERWRTVLAEAAGTRPSRVLVACVHQHDAPLFDLRAQQLLDGVGLHKALCDADFHERTVQRAAAALKDSLPTARRVTHLGMGRGEVREVASNRRVRMADGKWRWHRMSATRDPAIRGQPVGVIDPWLRTLSFWDGDRPVLALHAYATHPMSYYGQGEVSTDFVGMARARRQKDDPAVFQLYVCGCSGDVVAGKYNDGSRENRPVLADRIYRAMVEAWSVTRREPLTQLGFRAAALRFSPRDEGDFTEAALKKRLADGSAVTYQRVLAAMGLSWRERVAAGRPIDLPGVDFGAAQLVLMPGETFVEYQLMAQRLRPDSFVMCVGYGECTAGYIPTQQAVEEGFMEGEIWSWISPQAPDVLAAGVGQAMRR